MQKYIGTKQLLAKPMNREQYCIYRGWDVPDDENPADEGYLVEYLDSGKPNDERHKGYISWSPKDVFERVYRSFEGEYRGTCLTFGTALDALKSGKRVAREGWNGKGLFVFKQVPSPIPTDIVPKMTSLPQSVKDWFQGKDIGPNYRNQFAVVDASGNVDSWSPSGSDSVSEDWVILD